MAQYLHQSSDLGCMVCGSGQMCNDVCSLSQWHMGHSTALSVLCVPPTLPSLPPTPGNHWPFIVPIALVRVHSDILRKAYSHKTSISSVYSVVSDSLRPHGLQHTRPPCPPPTPRVCSNSCPSSQWCHPTISSSVVPFSSCLQPFPASESFLRSQFFTSVVKVLEPSALPMNIQDWFPLGWVDWISLQYKGLSRIFSNTTVQKHQFFGAQLSL